MVSFAGGALKSSWAHHSDFIEKMHSGLRDTAEKQSRAEQSKFKATYTLLYVYIWLACLQA